MENVRQFFRAGRGGLDQAHDLLVLLHEVQGIFDGMIERVVFLLAAE